MKRFKAWKMIDFEWNAQREISINKFVSFALFRVVKN